MVAEAKAETTAHDAVKAVADDAHTAVGDLTYAVDVTAKAGALAVAGDDTKADLFYFTNTTHVNDFEMTSFNKGDAIYVGEGYTLATGVTTAAGVEGFYVGTNTAIKEVFFTQNATTGVVSAVIEGNAVGHTAGTGVTDNITVITLTGITSLSDVSFANGVITSNHVAVA